MPAVDLAALADAGAFVSFERRAHLTDLLGNARWHVDAAAGTVTVPAEAGPGTVLRAHLLGSASPEERTWLWGWRNVSGFPPAVVRLAGKVRALGERYGIPELTEPELPLEDGLPERLVAAVSAVTGSAAALAVPTGTGATVGWLLLEDPSLDPPAPTVARTVAVITAALSGMPVDDHRRALTAWCRLRDVAEHTAAADVVEVALADGPLQVRFDGDARISGMGRRLQPSTEAEAPTHPRPPAEPWAAHDREQDRDRDQDRDREREQDRDREPVRDPELDRSREQDRDLEQNRERERRRNREVAREGDRDQDREGAAATPVEDPDAPGTRRRGLLDRILGRV